MIDGQEYIKVFNGPSGSWCYEKKENNDRTNTTTVTFRLSYEDAANLKEHIKNVVFNDHGGAPIDADYYDSSYHSKPVDLSNAYRVLSDMASQLSNKYPNKKNIDDR